MEILSNLERWSLYWNKAQVAGYLDEKDSHPARIIISIKTFDFCLNFHEFVLFLAMNMALAGFPLTNAVGENTHVCF